jgi:hypothetical protein
MSRSILPAADALDKANREAMDRGYSGVRAASLGAALAVLVAGAALLAALVMTQVFLYRRMRRLLNPALVAASLLVVVFLAWTLGAFLTQRAALKTAKEDAFESIHLLSRARAEAYDANGDESRWLLDRASAAEYEKDFALKAAALLTLPAGMSRQQLLQAVKQKQVPAGFKGYLADELRNITFAGEREAAVATVEAFVRYLDIDDEIRRLAKAGKHEAALALCLGEKPGESNWAFARFDEALGKTIAINQEVFAATVKNSQAGLAPFDLGAPLAALSVAVLALAGLWPRLREYAAN